MSRRGAVVRDRGRVHAVVDLLRAAWVEYERDHARYLAVAMIYYALVSLVPLLLLLLAALGLLLRSRQPPPTPGSRCWTASRHTSGPSSRRRSPGCSIRCNGSRSSRSSSA